MQQSRSTDQLLVFSINAIDCVCLLTVTSYLTICVEWLHGCKACKCKCSVYVGPTSDIDNALADSHVNSTT